jgi:transcriptional regulator with XRE-family HTH domain
MESPTPSRTDVFLAEHSITRTEVAEALGIDRSAVSRKLIGERPWKLAEIQGLIAYLAGKLGRPVAFDELFGEGAAVQTPESPEAA